MKQLELKIPPVVILLLGVVIAVVDRLYFGEWFPIHTLFPGIAFVIAGTMTGLAAVQTFRSAATSVDPRQPHKASSLVIEGIFKVSRNPMYLGLLFIQIGVALICSSFAGLCFAPLLTGYLTRFQIVPEERHMKEKFGEDYVLYRRQTRRWLGRYK
ncbi:isoprenylcysteine carboxylmethyltransferase family protein [Aestuariibacter sp. A3R04]|uniref:methyltransferase family protein n=1 Tax=Aestuariibacter sp. A3R04 TaxID=2841571 RepID=UPI001C09E5F8|nr:isoprenylcysteine carboxylmethyltransferase family protein [Aestuariibacter sp. A3R04]MBU3023286.1 isoprenylcysteine carboxylmethyltransferase family protein [Aestuariibacter sp. A3R04]